MTRVSDVVAAIKLHSAVGPLRDGGPRVGDAPGYQAFAVAPPCGARRPAARSTGHVALDLLRRINEARRIGQREAAEMLLEYLVEIDCRSHEMRCYWARESDRKPGDGVLQHGRHTVGDGPERRRDPKTGLFVKGGASC